MKNILVPENEAQRLKALKDYNILDTINEEEFDRLTRLASLICGTPIALVSLIDESRQWFKSNIGLEESKETPRDISFCQYTIMGDDVFEITDATKDSRLADNPLVTSDPEIRFYAGYPLKDPNGMNLGSLCVIDRVPKKLNDTQLQALEVLSKEVVAQIVSRKQQQEKLKLEKLFNYSLDFICIASTDGYFKKVNPSFLNVLGYSEKEILTIPFLDLVHDEDKEITRSEIEKLAQGFKTVNYKCRFRKKDGKYIVLNWIANPDLETGELYSVARDITEQIKQNETLNTYKFAIDQSAIVAITDQKGIITYVNDAFCDISKYSASELIGQDHRIINSGIHPKEFMKDLWTTIANGKVWKGEIQNKAKDGSPYWVDTTIIPFLNEKGKPYQYVAIRSDITEKIDSRKALIQKNVELDQFAYVVSHDLKAPLRAISTLTEFIQEDLEGNLEEETLKKFNLIISRTKRMQLLIDDILEYSKLGKTTVQKTLVNAEELLKEISNDFNKNPASFTIDIINPIPTFKVQKVFLQQIFANIISNAIKYNDKEHGHLTINCQEIDKFYQFKFTDNGPGIEKEYFDKIFEVFQTIHGEKRDDSTGIGLATVKKLVEVVNGNLYVESEFGCGSTFVINIPMD